MKKMKVTMMMFTEFCWDVVPNPYPFVDELSNLE